MKTVPLHGARSAGRTARVDDEFYEEVMKYRWNIWEDERLGNDGGPYAITHIWLNDHRTTIQMHTLISQLIAKKEERDSWAKVDHKDTNGLNNCQENLRDGSYGNTHNQRPRLGGTSKYKGVNFHKPTGKWLARITLEGKTKHLGLYIHEEDAARAYNEEALRLFGEYAYLNVITH